MADGKLFVSVIIPAHNAALHLTACLAALAETRYRHHEVIVVDDSSADNTRAVAEAVGAVVVTCGDGKRRQPTLEQDVQDIQDEEVSKGEGQKSRIEERSTSIDPRPSTLDPSPSCISCTSCSNSGSESPRGPAYARNRGAAVARGDILLFVDADVVVDPLTVGDVAAAFAGDDELAALFGSYDDRPAHPGFLSQYRNLFHHFIHQRASEAANSFWSGCGAIRRDVFLAAGGFDAARFGPPTGKTIRLGDPLTGLEDIDLGYRLSAAGCRIRLLKRLQVKHRKPWTLASMVRSDLFDRAIPWTRLSLERGGLPRDLNVSPSQRLAALCAGAFTAALAVSPLRPESLALALAALAGVVALNAPWYRFLLARRGPAFAARALPVQILYYHYSALGLLLGLALHARDCLGSRRPGRSLMTRELQP